MEERVETSSIKLSYVDYEELRLYTENKTFDEEWREKLTHLTNTLKRVDDLEDEAANLELDSRALAQDQERLRGNISTLRDVAGQTQRVQEMAEQLAQNETNIQQLQASARETRRQASGLGEQVETAIANLAF